MQIFFGAHLETEMSRSFITQMYEFIDPEWEDQLRRHKLGDFASLWERRDPWFEEPNLGRSKDGWSGVCRIACGERTVFLKKQENFYSYSLRHPLGVSLAQREFENILLFTERAIPTVRVLYFGVRRQNGKLQAQIMTESLDDYVSLAAVTHDWEKGSRGLEQRRELIASVAARLRDAHGKGVVHCNLYPKHIFVSAALTSAGVAPQEGARCCFIDLERARKVTWGGRLQLRDLETLHRKAPYWSRSDRLRFILTYLGKTSVDPEVRSFLRRLKKVMK